MKPRLVSTPVQPPVLDPEAGDLAVLDDVDAAPVGAARVAPCDGVMADGAAAPLDKRALYRKPAIVEIEERAFGAELLGVQKLGIGAVEDHRVAAPAVGVSRCASEW